MRARLQGWRIWRRLARAGRLLQPPASGYLLHRLVRPGLVPKALRAPQYRATPSRTALYRLWIRRYEPESERTREDRGVGENRSSSPEFSILVSGGDDPDRLDRTLKSVHAQSRASWEIHVGDDLGPASELPLAHLAAGDLLLHLRSGDELAAGALASLSAVFRNHPEVELAYADEDFLDLDGGRLAPCFKPDWNPELFWSSGYLGTAVVLRRRLVAKASDLAMSALPEAHDELIARSAALLPPEKIRHIPRVALHRGTSKTDRSRGRRTDDGDRAALVERLLSDGSRRVRTGSGPLPGTLRLRWPLPTAPPGASIVVLTHNGRDLLQRCLASVRRNTAYPDYEIIVVDHDSDDPATLELLHDLRVSGEAEVLRLEGDFNFSAFNNRGVERAGGDLLVFLNNDVEILSEGWLEEMASHALRPDVGAVGARLLYPDGRIQHGGVLLGGGAPREAVGGHFGHGLRRQDPGYFGRARLTQEVSAVTAACMVVRREVFVRAGGFDETELPVAFNDVDLCLRIRAAGYRIVWTPWAEAIHRESATRGNDLEGHSRERFRREARLMRRRWGSTLDEDPFYNPNLDPVDCDFALAFPPRSSA